MPMPVRRHSTFLNCNESRALYPRYQCEAKPPRSTNAAHNMKLGRDAYPCISKDYDISDKPERPVMCYFYKLRPILSPNRLEKIPQVCPSKGRQVH